MELIKNKKILFVINSLEGGGAEKVMCNWLREMENIFNSSNAEVTLLLLDSLPEVNLAPNYVNKVTLDSKGKIFRSYVNLKSAIAKLKPDIILSFLNRSNVICSLVGRKFNIPTIISERSNTSQHFGNSIKGAIGKAAIKYSYPLATKVLAVSEGVKLDLVKSFGVASSNCILLQNAYDISALNTSAQEPVPEINLDSEFIVAIGRLHHVKNFELLITSYTEAKIKFPLYILGEGPLKEALQKQINKLGQQKKIRLLGYQTNPYPYLKHAQFLVSTSNSEGFPNGIAEALCLGTPILATNCESGPAEILANNAHYKTDDADIVDFGVLSKPRSVVGMIKGFTLISALNKSDEYKLRLQKRAEIYSFDNVRRVLVEQINEAVGAK